MAIFYDPKGKKTQPWVAPVLVILPIALIILFIAFLYQMMKDKNPPVEEGFLWQQFVVQSV